MPACFNTLCKHTGKKNIVTLVLIIGYLISVPLFQNFNSRSATGFMQFLDADSLRDHLLQSLYLLHSQPPLLNFIVGLSFKLGGEHYYYILYTLQNGLLVANILLLLRICALIELPSFLAWATILSPSVYLYGNHCYESIYSFTFVNAAILGLIEFDKKYGVLIFLGSLALLSLTHSVFHPVLMIIFALLSYGYLRKRVSTAYSTRYFLCALALFFSLPLAVLAKNYVLFDIPTMSSWAGCNFAENTPLGLSGFTGFDAPQPPVDEANVLNTTARSSGGINFNYYGMIERCRNAEKRSLDWIQKEPLSYIKNIMGTFAGLGTQRSYDDNHVVYQWTKTGKLYFALVRMIFLTPFAYLMPVFIFLVPLSVFIAARFDKYHGRIPNLIPMVFFYYIHMLIICVFNGREQDRMNFRFYFFIILCLGFLVSAVIHRIKRRAGKAVLEKHLG